MRALPWLTLTAAALWAVAGPADASQMRPTPEDVGPLAGTGSYVVQTCGEPGSTTGWVLDPSSPYIDVGLDCPPVRGHSAAEPADLRQTGIWVSDRLGAALESPVGAQRDLTFPAPTGAAITRVRYWRQIEQLTEENWKAYIGQTGPNALFDGCEFDGQSGCSLGADDWYANDPDPNSDRMSYVDRTGLTASAFI